MLKIIRSKDINVINLKILATTLLGGLGPFTQDRQTLYRDANFVKDISHIRNCKVAKKAVADYTIQLKKDIKTNVEEEDEQVDPQFDHNLEINLDFLHNSQILYADSEID